MENKKRARQDKQIMFQYFVTFVNISRVKSANFPSGI